MSSESIQRGKVAPPREAQQVIVKPERKVSSGDNQGEKELRDKLGWIDVSTFNPTRGISYYEVSPRWLPNMTWHRLSPNYACPGDGRDLSSFLLWQPTKKSDVRKSGTLGNSQK